MCNRKDINELSPRELDIELGKVGQELEFKDRRRIIEGGKPDNEQEEYYQKLWIKVQEKNGN